MGLAHILLAAQTAILYTQIGRVEGISGPLAAREEHKWTQQTASFSGRSCVSFPSFLPRTSWFLPALWTVTQSGFEDLVKSPRISISFHQTRQARKTSKPLDHSVVIPPHEALSEVQRGGLDELEPRGDCPLHYQAAAVAECPELLQECGRLVRRKFLSLHNSML